jgi:hypothetical protein
MKILHLVSTGVQFYNFNKTHSFSLLYFFEGGKNDY